MAANATTALAAKTKASEARTAIMSGPLRFRGRPRQADPEYMSDRDAGTTVV
jgi:hypothetical protein